MPTMSNPALTTAEQLLTIEEPGYQLELVRGELRRMTGPGKWHGVVTMRLALRLGTFVESHGRGMTFAAETGFLLARDPDTVLGPDVSFVCTERLGDITGKGHFQGAPDLVAEVVSPGQSFTEVQEKVFLWLDHGVRVVWVVDPRARSVTVYRDRGEVRVLTERDELRGEDVLPGFGVAVAELFTVPGER